MVNFNNIIAMSDYLDSKKRKGANLRRLRETMGLHQWEIAEVLGCKTSNVSEMERGKRTISDRLIDIFCNHYHIDPEELLRNPNSPEITDPEERNVVMTMRMYPEMKEQLITIAEALAAKKQTKSSVRTEYHRRSTDVKDITYYLDNPEEAEKMAGGPTTSPEARAIKELWEKHEAEKKKKKKKIKQA